MPEQLDLTTPITTPDQTSWRVVYIRLDWELPEITIILLGTNEERLQHSYSGEVATTLMMQLNKVNLSVKSLQRRILERLIADGVFAGTISGTPD